MEMCPSLAFCSETCSSLVWREFLPKGWCQHGDLGSALPTLWAPERAALLLPGSFYRGVTSADPGSFPPGQSPSFREDQRLLSARGGQGKAAGHPPAIRKPRATGEVLNWAQQLRPLWACLLLRHQDLTWNLGRWFCTPPPPPAPFLLPSFLCPPHSHPSEPSPCQPNEPCCCGPKEWPRAG